jgi:hypothetical protein
VCGLIGHVDKECNLKLKRGEKTQFGGWLRADFEKGGIEDRVRNNGGGNRTSGGGRTGGFNRWNSNSVRADLPWRKEPGKVSQNKGDSGKEVDTQGLQNLKGVVSTEKVVGEKGRNCSKLNKGSKLCGGWGSPVWRVRWL